MGRQSQWWTPKHNGRYRGLGNAALDTLCWLQTLVSAGDNQDRMTRVHGNQPRRTNSSTCRTKTPVDLRREGIV